MKRNEYLNSDAGKNNPGSRNYPDKNRMLSKTSITCDGRAREGERCRQGRGTCQLIQDKVVFISVT